MRLDTQLVLGQCNFSFLLTLPLRLCPVSVSPLRALSPGSPLRLAFLGLLAQVLLASAALVLPEP